VSSILLATTITLSHRGRIAIVLATGEPRAEARGEQIIVTIPSGKDVIEIALSPHQALNLLGDTRLAIEAVFADLKQRANAEVIPLKGSRQENGGPETTRRRETCFCFGGVLFATS
jgi:hypothetical protein